ncbi:sugar phosphate isomerase/epimerase [bacterium]|nr:sugar phosphate isomerase/epimerase [bacterium]
MMFFNVSTNIYKQLPLDKTLTTISDMGFKNVEIYGDHFKKLCEDKEYLSQIVKAKKINIYSVHSYLNDLTNSNFSSLYKETYHNRFTTVRTLGASLFVMHVGDGRFEEWNKIKEEVFCNCQQLAELAKEYRLIIGLENDWGGGGPLRKVEQFEELIKAVNRDNFRITLDGKHSMPFPQYPLEHQANGPEEFIERLSKYIVNYHSAELDGPFPLGLGDWDVSGTGSGRLGKVIKMLKKTGYQGPITIELQSDLIQKSLDVAAEVLSKTGTELGELPEALKDKYFLGRKMLNYSRKYLVKFM